MLFESYHNNTKTNDMHRRIDLLHHLMMKICWTKWVGILIFSSAHSSNVCSTSTSSYLKLPYVINTSLQLLISISFFTTQNYINTWTLNFLKGIWRTSGTKVKIQKKLCVVWRNDKYVFCSWKLDIFDGNNFSQQKSTFCCVDIIFIWKVA